MIDVLDVLGLLPLGVTPPADFVQTFNLTLFIVLTICYGYQILYVFLAIRTKGEVTQSAVRNHRFAVLIAARNESETIGNLLHSISQQDYPSELIDVYVIADNCTDNTAEIARSYGAVVFERQNTNSVGKGYALDYGYQMIRRNQHRRNHHDAFLVFDADNLLDPGFVSAMNRTLNQGADISTSYRNSKNYTSSTIGFGLIWLTLLTLVACVSNYLLIMFILGIVTTIAEWKSIHAKTYQKVLYLFTFPIFMLTYIPIAIVALFRKPEWKPIRHNVNLSIEEIMQDV